MKGIKSKIYLRKAVIHAFQAKFVFLRTLGKEKSWGRIIIDGL
jgi:hypothetical protein